MLCFNHYNLFIYSLNSMKEIYFNFLVLFSKYYHTILNAQKNGILNFYILVFSFSILLIMGMFYVILLINSKRIIRMTFPSYLGWISILDMFSNGWFRLWFEIQFQLLCGYCIYLFWEIGYINIYENQVKGDLD